MEKGLVTEINFRESTVEEVPIEKGLEQRGQIFCAND